MLSTCINHKLSEHERCNMMFTADQVRVITENTVFSNEQGYKLGSGLYNDALRVLIPR